MPPPPPPPPPGMKPPAPASASKSSAGAGDGRGMLLESIRQGKALKKTQVNDRSAPAVQTSKPTPTSPETRSGGSSNNGRGQGLTAPPGLAGLFAGGMPKLKPVGGGGARTPIHQSPQKLGPPEPPPASQKPLVAQQVPDEPPQQERKLSIGKPSVAPKPPALHTKGPRPNPPPKLSSLVITPQPVGDDDESPSPPPGVNRAQSMRLTRSSSPTQTRGVPIEYRTMGRAAAKTITPQPPPPPRNFQNGSQRPRNAPMRPPSARPPPPPNKVPPAHPPPPPPLAVNNSFPPPPPPPPTNSIPPPPFGTSNSLPPPPLSTTTGLPPPPPPHRGMVNQSVTLNGNLGPPPPPTRNSSIRNVNAIAPVVNTTQSTGTGVDLEARFRHLFIPIENLPKPEQFTGFTKTYPSKIAQSQKRQPAPQPPTQVQLGHKMWVNNSSAC